ncbi:MAG: hypothetical protein D3906_00860 [Candidatus Electrothrix sp. AUS1_2]|nr:hypothetical protein [Candidatus Electrothrix sp. AUS1_2]
MAFNKLVQRKNRYKSEEKSRIGYGSVNWGHTPISPETLTNETGLPRTSFAINIPDIFGSTFSGLPPVVAIGYDDIADDGPKFTGVQLSRGFGDDMYDLRHC